ncbi:inositol monophosphatase family protein [Ensifer sesbaniae]|uniref:inositol monophosphatase family protein n=1 Tax=Ensifer sesbaniae TaxID=1214071 RepID=UPI001FE75B02|nr:inositol monophosphatase family protein [Ensifer sesbaniae]
MIWDSAAGQALIEATGGVVLRRDGSLLVYSDNLINQGFVAARTRSLAEKGTGRPSMPGDLVGSDPSLRKENHGR